MAACAHFQWADLLAAANCGESARMVSVAPTRVTDSLLRALVDVGVKPQLLDSRAPHPDLHLSYAPAGSLGGDRLLGMLAARHRYSGAVVVVSAGTAFTVDGVDAAGHHLGGCIAPGVGAAAAALPEVLRGRAEGAPVLGAGQSTEGCLRAGLGSLYAGALQHWRTVWQDHRPGLVVTGGDAEYIATLAAAIAWRAEVRQCLVLDGLKWALP